MAGIRSKAAASNRLVSAWAWRSACSCSQRSSSLPHRCLLRLHDEATGGDLDGAGIQAWLEWEWEAMRWGVPAQIARGDLEGLVERSTVLLEREKHRLIHGSDWQRWGRRGGLATLGRYGTSWYSMLALKRWGGITEADYLEAARGP